MNTESAVAKAVATTTVSAAAIITIR